LGERLLCKQDVAGSTPVSSKEDSSQFTVTSYQFFWQLATGNWKLLK
jgi:hypothetical protein